VSSPQTRHSRNLAQRSDVSLAIFDSHAVVGKAEAVYLTATAVQVPDEELESAVAIYNSRLPELKRFEPQELVAPGLFRLYRATATEHSVLIRGSDPEYGKGGLSADDHHPVTQGVLTQRSVGSSFRSALVKWVCRLAP
jgi:hypothetical protein